MSRSSAECSQDVMSDGKEVWTYKNVIVSGDRLSRPEERLQQVSRTDWQDHITKSLKCQGKGSGLSPAGR